MKKVYLSPDIRVEEVTAGNFMEIISDGGGHYHEDIDPNNDPASGDDARAPKSIWDEKI